MDPAPSEKIESPSHVADEFAYEKLKIIWDADVTVPEIGAYAVMRVQKRELSKDELLSVIEGLTGTTNDIYTSWTMNRSEVQAMLEEAAPYEGTERLPKEYLKNLKNLLKNAPERNENILADQNKLVTYSSLYVPVSGGTAAQFVLSDGFLYYVRDIHTEAYPQWDMMESQFDSSYETKSHFKWKKPGEPELPKEAALAVAEEYLREMGMELVVKENRHLLRAGVAQIFPVNRAHTSVDDGLFHRHEAVLAAHDQLAQGQDEALKAQHQQASKVILAHLPPFPVGHGRHGDGRDGGHAVDLDGSFHSVFLPVVWFSRMIRW